MQKKRLLHCLLTIALAMSTPVNAGSDSEVITEIDWNALIAKSWNPQERLNEFSQSDPSKEELYAEMERLSSFAPVEESLNGEVVKLPGYVVPLEYEGTRVKEFLLVPYVGACIHVPPPPANQVVYVKASEEVELEGLYTPVWVTGKMTTTSVTSELAEAGYTMDLYEVIPYEY